MYWFILLTPLLVAWGAKFYLHNTITWKEMGVQMTVCTLVVGCILFAGQYSQSTDVEVWNGQVVGKEKVRVSCSHSYDCNCTTTTDSKGNSTTSCQTCYDHSYDNDWRVQNNIESYMNIQREDRQGLTEPSRWSRVQIGEPFSTEHRFQNYIKAVPESIFGEEVITDPAVLATVPAYPEVYDYYRINRVLNTGVPIKDHAKWNKGMNEIAKKLGNSKQVNPILIFANTDDPTYQYILEKVWLNGKKNDMIVIIGAKSYPQIDFVRVIGWENEEIKHYLKEQLTLFDTLNDEYREYALSTIKENILLHFNRMKMVDYEYLKDQIEPPLWVILVGFLVAVLGSVGMTYYFHTQDPFNDHGGFRSRRRPPMKFRNRGSSKRTWRT